MKKLKVIYSGWGEHFELGVLADDNNNLLFEYTAEALERGLELSPYKLPLSALTYSDFPEHQYRLPGLVSDALPDGWGMLLMDRLFRKQGRNPARISPLDRLAFIADSGMGALSFEPAQREKLTPEDLQLLDLAREVREVLENESETLLLELLLMGGSPHGARPKILVNFDEMQNRMSNSPLGAGTPIMVKFPAQNEHKEVCAIEALYGRVAAAMGMSVPKSYYFDLDKNHSAFGIERFDRFDGMRVPLHTAAGAAHVDFRSPQLDYTALLRLTRKMTRDEREVLRAFERCVFNVAFNNRDDHSKNFSFLLGKDGRWQFSPGYDLTFNRGPHGEHQMDICGEARKPRRRHLLELAKNTGVSKDAALEIIERTAAVALNFTEFAANLPIRTATLKSINDIVRVNRQLLITVQD